MRNPFKSSAVGVAEAERLSAESGVVLVDVRTRQEWKEGHAPNAIHISLASLETQLRRIPDDATVLAICRSGSRSAQAVRVLQAAGRDARNVKGGMIAWNREGLPVTKR